MAIALARCADGNASSREAATAAPTGAQTAVGCQPASYSAGWLAAASAAIAS